MLIHNVRMAQKKKAGDRARKPYKFVRIKHLFVDAARAASEEIGHDLTQYVNDALRMRLAAEGKWPPPPPKPPAR